MAPSPYEVLDFVNQDSVAHTVVFAHRRCSLDVPPGEAPPGRYACDFWDGSYAYTVDGRFSGRVDVVGLVRSVSLTARTHSVTRGGRLTLHGEIREVNTLGVPGRCSSLPSSSVWVLRRHNRRHPFRRIVRRVPVRRERVRPGRHGCVYRWQLTVRPGERITYVAEMTGVLRLWRLARSRPFTVLTRT